jgi:hypothetical protein
MERSLGPRASKSISIVPSFVWRKVLRAGTLHPAENSIQVVAGGGRGGRDKSTQSSKDESWECKTNLSIVTSHLVHKFLLIPPR